MCNISEDFTAHIEAVWKNLPVTFPSIPGYRDTEIDDIFLFGSGAI